MANGFGTMYVGASGLQMAQNALNTTANNLANVDTKGYVRQQVRFADRNYSQIKNVTTKTNMMQSGLGVSIGDVAHARDIFLDKSYRLENGRCEFYSALYEATSYVEDLYQELDGQEFKATVQEMWQAVQEIAKAPDDSTNMNLLVQKAQLLVSRSQALYSDLQSYQSNINLQINDEVNRANEIGDRIYELNLSIQKVESGGVETAMTLRDERDKLIDELSGFSTVDVTEDATGFVYVEIEGVQFVDDAKCHHIAMRTDDMTGFDFPYWPQLSNLDKGEYVPVYRLDTDIDTEFNNDVGSIKSKLLTRGDGYGHFDDLDPATYKNVNKSLLMENEAQVEKLFHNIVTTMNDLLCPNISVVGDITDAAGNVVIADGAKILDVDNCTVGADGEIPPRELFTRAGVDRYKEVVADGKTYYVYQEETPRYDANGNKLDTFDASSLYSLKNVSINSDLTKQVTLLPMWNQDGAVSFDMGQRIKDAWANSSMTLNPDDTAPVTFENFYDKMISELGTLGNTYKAASETLTGTVESVENNRQQVTGVSSDEELTRMIKFQSAYNASSRFITVISQMTELIVTGLI